MIRVTSRFSALLVLLLAAAGCGHSVAQSTAQPLTRVRIDCRGAHSVTLHEVRGMPLFIVCRDSKDLENLKRLDDQVFDRGLSDPGGTDYRALRRDVSVVIAVSPYSKCRVDHVARAGNKQGWSAEGWLGGFHSPCHSEVFDLAGRQIKPGPFSPTKFPKFVGNLPVPKYRFASEGEIEISD